MRTECPNCKHRYDVPHGKVLKEAARLGEKRGGKSVVERDPLAPDVDGNRRPDAPKSRTINLIVDELDYEMIQSYIADYQAAPQRIAPGEPTIIPDGESSLAGAIMAECVRDLMEYRAVADVERDFGDD